MLTALAKAVYGAAAGSPVQRTRTSSSGNFDNSPGGSSSSAPPGMEALAAALQKPGQQLAPPLLDFVAKRLSPGVMQLLTAKPRDKGSQNGSGTVPQELDASDAQGNMFLKDFVELQVCFCGGGFVGRRYLLSVGVGCLAWPYQISEYVLV